MRKAISLRACLGLAFLTGCANIQVKDLPWLSKLKEKEDFRGWYLTVWVDGKQTHEGEKLGRDQTWEGGQVSTTPTIKVAMDTARLGSLKSAEILLNPVSARGGVDGSDMWQPKAKLTEVGKGIKLGPFDHIGGGKMVKADALPPGRYRLSVHIDGEKTWDRQYVMITVR